MISHSHPATHASTTLWYCSSPAPRSLHQLERQDLPKGRHPREHSPVVPLWASLALLCLLSRPISCNLLLPPQKFLCASSWRKATHTNLFEESLSSLSQDLFFYWALQKVTFNIKYGSKHKISFSYVFFLQNCLLFLNFPFSFLSQDWMLVFLFVFLFLFKEHLRMIIILHSWISACLCCDLIFVDSFVV